MPPRAGALRRVSADHGAGMGPIRLSDAQLDAIMRACQPLRPDVRSAFVEAVVSALKDREIGDGAVYLAIARAQRIHPVGDALRIVCWCESCDYS